VGKKRKKKHPLPLFKMHTKKASKGPRSSNALKKVWEGKKLSITVFLSSGFLSYLIFSKGRN